MKWCLFGAGTYGKQFYDELSQWHEIVGFYDSAPEKHGALYCDLPVKAPEEHLGLDDDIGIIIASDLNIDMIWQLFCLGIKKSYTYNMADRGTGNLTLIDLSQYDKFDVAPEKIVFISHGMSGNNGGAIMKLAKNCGYKFHQVIDSSLTTEDIVNIFTCALLFSSHHQSVKGKPSVSLWHGFPMKTLGLASLEKNEVRSTKERNAYIFQQRKAICSYSALYNFLMSYSFGVLPEKFVVTGMPRNDYLFFSDGKSNLNKILDGSNYKKILLYAPTFRGSVYNSDLCHGSAGFIFNLPGFDWQKTERFLVANDILLLLKFHPYDSAVLDVNCKNMHIINDEMFIEHEIDFYEILNAVDVLITDYSSLYFDYLLLDRPIIFTPVDLEDYRKNKGLMLEPYEQWTPGPKALDFKTLLHEIELAIASPEMYHDARDHMLRITHKYVDGNSTGRVLELIKSFNES